VKWFLIFAALPLSAQLLPATFSPQSADVLKTATGRPMKHLQLLSVTVCAGTTPATQSGGDLYRQAFSAGYVTLIPPAVKAAMQHAAADDWRKWFGWGTPILSGAATGAATSGVINIAERNKSKWETAGVVLTGSLVALASQIQGRAPDPTAILAGLVDPAASYPLQASSCWQGVIGAQR